MQKKIPAIIAIVLLFGILTYFSSEAPKTLDVKNGLCVYAPEASDAITVLFIGNDHTAANTMPELVRCIAASQDKAIKVETVILDNASIKDHWENGEAFRKIHAHDWDFVVLQERPDLVLNEKSKDDFYSATTLFLSEIRKIGAKPLLFGMYARKFDTAVYRGSQRIKNSEEMQDSTSYEYIVASSKLNVPVVPVGQYWAKVIKKDRPGFLYEKGEVSPNLYGSYLTALVFSKQIANVDLDSPVWFPKELDEAKVQKLLGAM